MSLYTEIAWPTPGPKDPPLSGTTTEYVALPVNIVSTFHFKTPAQVGAKAGQFQLIYADVEPDAYAGLWPWAWCLSAKPGDMTVGMGEGSIGNSEGPVISWRGVPTPTTKGTTPMPMLVALTDYYINVQPKAGNPMGTFTRFGLRATLQAGRQS